MLNINLKAKTPHYLPAIGGDTGKTVETREYEPLPETAPVHEPTPEPAPAEPVPA